MAIEYRTVDAEATRDNVLKQRAIEAEQVAYQQEIEAKRLDALEVVAKTKEEKKALKDSAKATREASANDRKRANRLNQGGAAKEEDLANARREFLTNWITSLEGEHVSHSVLLSQREESLATTGDAAPSDEDKVRIQANIQSNKDALVVIESAWKVATTELDAL